jgi:2'-5' RNA ligase
VTSPRARRRLFVALEVTGSVAPEVDGLRRAIGSSSLGRIAPHLTLVPPVNVAEAELGDALALLRSVSGEEAVPVALGPAASFSGRSPVLFLEVSDPSRRIERLQRRLEAVPLAAPTTRPTRPFSAHVTLSGRMERRAKDAAIELFANFKVETVLSRLTLYEQHHEEKRHPWFPLADVVLGAGTPGHRGGRDIDFVVSRVPGPDVSPLTDERGRPDGGDPIAVIGRVGDVVVATAHGATVGSQLVIDSWWVEDGGSDEGAGRALLGALERASSGLGSEVLFVAASSDTARAFLQQIGFVPVVPPISTGAETWFAPRR